MILKIWTKKIKIELCRLRKGKTLLAKKHIADAKMATAQKKKRKVNLYML